MNRQLKDLLHGDERWLEGAATPTAKPTPVVGGITSEEEEQQLQAVNAWIGSDGLPGGELSFDFSDPDTGDQKAVLDLAWPQGIQEELSQPVALLLNEGADVIALASQAGFRCFTDTEEFRHYVKSEILAQESAA